METLAKMNRNEWKKIWHHGVHLAKHGQEKSGDDYTIPATKSVELGNTDINDKEWVACVRLALLSPVPSLAFEYWREEGWLAHALPEVNKAWGMNQPELHHPEIDTGIHLMMVIDRASADGCSEMARWAALAHDFGKHATYKVNVEEIKRESSEENCQEKIFKTRYTYHDHEKQGVPFVQQRFTGWNIEPVIFELALSVTEYHGLVHTLDNLKATTILKIIKNAEIDSNPEKLNAFCEAVVCDDRGRKGMFNNIARGTELLKEITLNLIEDRKGYAAKFEQDWNTKVERLLKYKGEDISDNIDMKESLYETYFAKYEANSIDSFLKKHKATEANNLNIQEKKHGPSI